MPRCPSPWHWQTGGGGRPVKLIARLELGEQVPSLATLARITAGTGIRCPERSCRAHGLTERARHPRDKQAECRTVPNSAVLAHNPEVAGSCREPRRLISAGLQVAWASPAGPVGGRRALRHYR